MGESICRKVDKISRVSKERITWDPWGEERGLWLSRRRKGQTFFFLHYFLFSSVAQSYLTLCNPMDCSMPDFPDHHWLTELTQTHAHWVGDVIQPSYPLSLPSAPAFNCSQHQGPFQLVSSWHQLAKIWSFSIRISPSKESSWLISFRMNWLDHLSVQKTLNSLLQHHSSKSYILKNTLLHISQQDPLWPTYKNIGNKSKNKQMGPNET